MTKEQLLARVKPQEAMKSIAQQAAFFALGLLAARAVVFGRCAPFGVAMAAAGPWEYTAAITLGAALGYILPGAVTVPMHCLMALFACVGIRWALQGQPCGGCVHVPVLQHCWRGCHSSAQG